MKRMSNNDDEYFNDAADGPTSSSSDLEESVSESEINEDFSTYNDGVAKQNTEDFVKRIEQVGVTNKIGLDKECSNNLFVKTEEGFPNCVDNDNTEDSIKAIEPVGVTNKIAPEKECSSNLFVKTEEGFPDCVDTDNTENYFKPVQQVGATNKIAFEKDCSNNLIVKTEEGFPDCIDTDNVATQNLGACSKGVILELEGACGDHVTSELVGACRVHVKSELAEWQDSGSRNVPALPFDTSGLPKSALVLLDAIKMNRSYQKAIKNKLTQVHERIEEIKSLNDSVKILNDFQTGCKNRIGRALVQKKEAHVQLISAAKEMKSNYKKAPAMYYGPQENLHVDVYKEVLVKFPSKVTREKWSKKEIENLKKGVHHQIQEQLLKSFYILNDTEESSIEGSNLDMMVDIIKDCDITPQNMRSFLPKINWEQLSSMYVPSRSGMECQSRWLNFEDPLINRNPWTNMEDTNILHIAQKKGPNNWIDIAVSLGTNRTPFQCLARYQRSLNASILRREWTKEEDIKLHGAIEEYGENNWQSVASFMEGRTGTQCSNRWQKSIHPAKRVGKWTLEEDKVLKVAVMIFGPKNWHKIAELVPGRMQSQCRERWANSLDPSLNFGVWTSEEDLLLKEAIQEHGYCWSKVASCVHHRTDNQCSRRWAKLFPEQVTIHLAAKKAKRSVMISNFVDRASERPAIDPSDFVVTLNAARKDTKQKLKSNKKKILIPKCENPDNLESSDSIVAITPNRCKFGEIDDMTLASFLGQSCGLKSISQSAETLSTSAEDDSTAQVDENDSAAGVSRLRRPKRSRAMEETSSDRMQVDESADDLPLSRFCKTLKRSKRVKARLL